MCVYFADDLQLSEIHFDTNFEEHVQVKVKLKSIITN